jgi:hypothetical protein
MEVIRVIIFQNLLGYLFQKKDINSCKIYIPVVELSSGVFLMALDYPAAFLSSPIKEKLEGYNILFKGDLPLLMEFSEKYVMEVETKKYKDYYYNSSGFPAPTMSLQSAIWKAEEQFNKPNNSTFFVIVEEPKDES